MVRHNLKRVGVLALAAAAGLVCLAPRASAQYCSVSTQNNAVCTTTYEYINNVTIGSINDTEPCSVQSYQDQTAQSANVIPGVDSPLSVTIGSYWGADYVTAFVDWDNNFSFDDAGEAYVIATGGGTGTGGGSMTFNTTINPPATAALGPHRMRVWLTYNIAPTSCLTGQTFGQIKDYTLNVVSPSNPVITGQSVTGNVGSTVLLIANTLPGSSPASTSLAVTGDLSSIGGSSTQTFYDNGTHGDVTANDGVFSFSYAVPHAPTQSAGNFAVPVTVTDNLSRTGQGSISVHLNAEPIGGCCAQGVCSIVTAYNCAGNGGSYAGDGTNCGTTTYPMSDSSAQFVDISGTGSPIGGLNCDDCYQSISLPFSFTFYGNSYTTAAVASNGFMTFDAETAGSFAPYFNDVPPTTGVPNNAIYPFWDDLLLTTSGTVYTQTDGNAPNRTFTVAWINVPKYSDASLQNFEAILYETSNNIEFRYGSISSDVGGSGPGGGDRTIGVENADGSAAQVYPTSANLGTGNMALMLTYTLPPTCGPTCGSADFNHDGDTATDADIEDFFRCIAGNCCQTCDSADFNGDGDSATDADIEAFFRVLAGGNC